MSSIVTLVKEYSTLQELEDSGVTTAVQQILDTVIDDSCAYVSHFTYRRYISNKPNKHLRL